MRCTLPCTTPPRGRARSTTWSSEPARLSMNARSTLPVYEPSIWPAMFRQSGRHGYRARWGYPTARDTSGSLRPIQASSPASTTVIFSIQTTSGECGEGLRLAARLLESDAFKDVADYRIHPASDILANDDALDLWIRQTVGTARHVSGTCKMGPDTDPSAIVDQYCRVKGIESLWVADASVMPRIPRSGGAHATVIMIGAGVVDWVAAG